MSDTEPTPPAGAHAAGRAVVILGWLLYAAAVALVVFMIVQGTFNAGGLFLSLLVAGVGWAAVSIGNSIQNSRAGQRPINRG